VVSSGHTASPEGGRSAQHRYGLVLALTILAVLFSVIAPETRLGRAISVLLQGAMLFAIILTSREAPARRSLAASLTVVLLAVLAALVGFSVVPHWVGAAGAAIAVLAALIILTLGVVHLISTRGVTLQAIAGSLTSYLLIGLLFALVVRVLVGVSPHPYFEQVSNAAVTQSQQIYFSFTTLTTTGYGDLTPTLNLGRALSVLEMLVGQIYLVTVIGLLIGNLRRGSERAPET
jgi:Ion channel